MEVSCPNAGYPYHTAGSFIEYFEGLTYEHVNFIFSCNSQVQNAYAMTNSNLYKFGFITNANTYYDYIRPLAVHDHFLCADEYERHETFDANDAIDSQWHGSESSASHGSNIECLTRDPNSDVLEVMWEDSLDPDAMTYEELLELGETVGTQSRGLSHELISMLPVSKYKRSFFLRRKSRSERCVICQMEYKRGERRITLPCKHIYHATCGAKWLNINKACPICFTEVFADGHKH